MTFLINKEWLVRQLDNPLVKIIDCRFNMATPDEGYQDYQTHHIPGSVYFDLNKDLSGPVREHGGRHPLPDLNLFKEKLERAGISNATTIVAYDDGSMANAARFSWLLRYLGHEQVFILEEGYKGWTENDFPVTNSVVRPESAVFTVHLQGEILADYEEVKKAVQEKTAQLIDSRAPERYSGEVEPLDSTPGHIPGAVNYFWEDENNFAELDKEQPVIVYCGSGITAAPNYFALKEAGFSDVKLYAGSYSDWISYPENTVER